MAKGGGRRNVGKGVKKGRCVNRVKVKGKVEKIVMGPARLTPTLAGKMAFKCLCVCVSLTTHFLL